MHGIREAQQLYLVKKIPLLDQVGFRILKATENLSPVDRTVCGGSNCFCDRPYRLL